MFYEMRRAAYLIKSVYRVARGKLLWQNSERSYATLTYRMRGKCVYSWENGAEEKVFRRAEGESVNYLPSGLSFLTEGEEEELIAVRLFVFGEDDPEIAVLDGRTAAACGPLFRELLAEWEGRAGGYVNRCMILLCRIFETIEKSKRPAPDRRTALIREGADYLNRHFREPGLTVGKLAEQCFISEVYFRRLFREVYGVTPLARMNEMRLDFARELIGTEGLPVGEAAEQAGFADPDYFRSVFRKRFGCAPSALRTRPALPDSRTEE